MYINGGSSLWELLFQNNKFMNEEVPPRMGYGKWKYLISNIVTVLNCGFCAEDCTASCFISYCLLSKYCTLIYFVGFPCTNPSLLCLCLMSFFQLTMLYDPKTSWQKELCHETPITGHNGVCEFLCLSNPQIHSLWADYKSLSLERLTANRPLPHSGHISVSMLV